MNKLKNILKWLREKDAGKITYKIDCYIKNVESTCNQAQNNNGNNGAINDTIRIELLNVFVNKKVLQKGSKKVSAFNTQ